MKCSNAAYKVNSKFACPDLGLPTWKLKRRGTFKIHRGTSDNLRPKKLNLQNSTTSNSYSWVKDLNGFKGLLLTGLSKLLFSVRLSNLSWISPLNYSFPHLTLILVSDGKAVHIRPFVVVSRSECHSYKNIEASIWTCMRCLIWLEQSPKSFANSRLCEIPNPRCLRQSSVSSYEDLKLSDLWFKYYPDLCRF